jgi:undecaprenyl-diphosphatase
MFINLVKTLLLGLVEGITEWLPVSSTGHMILLDEFLRLDVSPAFMEMFRVVIQLGAVLAVVAVYFRRLFPVLPSNTAPERRDALRLWGKILAACLPAAVVGLLFDDKIDALFYNWQTVAAALIVYGVCFILLEKRGARTSKINVLSDITYKTALLIGGFQLLALVPGTSRSGATILGAILLGASRTVAAEFTFFLAVPVMLGAGGLKLLKFGLHFTGAETAILLVGAVTAFFVSLAAIRFLVGFVKKHSFVGFGWYRVALGALVILYFALA